MSGKDMGTVTVSKRVALRAAEYITKNTDGVIAISPRSMLRGPGHGGIRLVRSGDGYTAEINIICRYGINTNELCRKLSSDIRSELEYNMGVPLSRVAVRIDAVERTD